MNKEKIYTELREYCYNRFCSSCRIDKYNPKHSCGNGYCYRIYEADDSSLVLW